MQIKGTDGLTPEMIRDEVARGGRLVIYSYCVSIILMTFKRPTDIYFVRPGQSPVVRGLPFALVTLLFGWWGFPWGPIYSIECLYKTLTGGIDVTHDVLASLLPPSLPGASPTHQALPPRPPAKQLSRKQLLWVVGAVALAVTGIYASICAHAGDNLRVAVLNGLPTRVSYTINAQPVTLGPGGYQLLDLPEGEFTVGATADRSAQSFVIQTPFWSRPFRPRIAVINPDHTALFYHEHVIYKGDHATGDNHGQPTAVTFYTNQNHYLLDAPDYAFVDVPKNISMPSGTGFTSKTRLALDASRTPGDRLEIVLENLGRPAAETYARALALNQPDNEAALIAAFQVLKPEEALALLESRLDARPLSVEWHRSYQTLFARLHPDVDLRDRYNALSAAAPDDGALHYLVARIEPDSADSRPRYELALSAARPCAYAHLGLGYLDIADGGFEGAFNHYDSALKAGIKNESVLSARREMLLALRRYDTLLADIRQRRAADPLNLLLAAEEIRCVLAANAADIDTARQIETTVLDRGSAFASPEDKQKMRAFLDAALAYALGDEATFARSASLLDGPRYAFQVAICERDHRAARLAVKDTAHLPADYLFTLHLVAQQAGDTPAAQTYWNEAVHALSLEGGSRQRVAEQLAGRAPLDPELLRTASLMPVQKSLIFTALGLRDASQRMAYYAWAAQNNFQTEFPCLLIKSIIQPPAKTARL